MQYRRKILLLFPHFNTMSQAGALRSWQIGRFLAKQGHQVTVVAPGVDLRSGKMFPEVVGRLFSDTRTEGLRLVRVASIDNFRTSAYKRLSFEIIFSMLAFIRALFIRPVDVIVAAYPPPIMPGFAYLLSLLRRRPIILDVRDLMADALVVTGYIKMRILLKFAKALERFVVRNVDHVIAVSNGISSALKLDSSVPISVTVNTNGYEPEVFDQPTPDLNPRRDFSWGNKFVVVYAGGLTESYDVPTLLRSAKRLKNYVNIHFAIIGEGNRKQDYEQYCRANHLTNCQFIGYQERRRMPTILKSANVGVHLFRKSPLWSYVLGNKTFDYLGSGLPMVYAGTGDTADLIQDAKAGYVVEPENDEELAGILRQMADDQSGIKAMGERGRQYVKRFYNRHDLLRGFETTLLSLPLTR